MKIHNAGNRILVTAVLAGLITAAAAILLLTLWLVILCILAVVFILVLVFRFFRLPEREVSVSQTEILAPADGTVVVLEKATEEEYFRKKMVQVSIFMSIHNVHKNWYPLEGTVKYVRYHPGKYLVARHPKSSALNERTSVVIGNTHTEIMVRQIAGFVARRIFCAARPGEYVTQRDELGFIRFGSRLDLFIPESAAFHIKPGDRTIGGITRIASV